MTTPQGDKHIPSGSMCMSCAHFNRGCRHLNFEQMQPMKMNQDFIVVRCSDYQRGRK